jgi:hypothetical protein
MKITTEEIKGVMQKHWPKIKQDILMENIAAPLLDYFTILFKIC